jgi:hypothetical protein
VEAWLGTSYFGIASAGLIAMTARRLD